MKAVEDMTVDQAQAEVKRLRAHLEEIRIAVDRTELASVPKTVWVTHDRKFGVTLVHATRMGALRERSRDHKWIDIIAFDRRTSEARPK